MKHSLLVAIFGFTAITGIGRAETATFNFAGDASTTGNPLGDTLSLTPNTNTIPGLTSVKVTSYNTNTTVIPTGAALGSTALAASATDLYKGYGLALCGNGEGVNCGSPQHQIDNTNGAYEFMLFKFNVPVNLTSIKLLDYQGKSMDMSYWTGTTAPAATTVSSLLSSFGAQTNVPCVVGGAQTSCSGNGSGTYSTITDSISGSDVLYLLVAASFNTGTTDDTFKVEALNVSMAAPEPATFGLAALTLAGLGLIARSRTVARA